MQTLPLGIRPVQPTEDTGSTTITLGAGATAWTDVCSIQFKNALRPFLIFIANALDAGLINFVQFRLVVDDQPYYPFHGPTLGQWADPAAPQQEISPYLELPQFAKAKIQCQGLVGNQGGNVTGRLRGLYGMIDAGVIPT